MNNNKTNSNDFAFACVDNPSHLQEGLTKREYFAAMALQGILASDINSKLSIGVVTEYAVRQAESLIKALNNEQQ